MSIADMIEAGHVPRLKELALQRLSGDDGPVKGVDRGAVHLCTSAAWAKPIGDEISLENENGGLWGLPPAVFAAKFQPLSAMSFGHAMMLFREGFRVKRRDWIDDDGLSMKSFDSLDFLSLPDLLADDWQIVGTRRDI